MTTANLIQTSHPSHMNEEDEAARFEDTVRYNIRRYMRLTGKLQKDLARAMGVTRPAVTLMLNGGSEIRLKKMYLAARELGVTISDLTDDTYYRQDEDFLSRFEANNKKATGDTPMASGELLRLGLNQRPSDIRFWLAAVGLFATEIENTPALLVLQIGVSRQFFSMHLVFRRASAVGKNIG